ncbi:MAG: PadR family transcriptional regulator [Thaumarchaeota archaeon]|nr:PadR family transcriptional regulator [Nitrososphaerota archaeon]
MQEKETAPGKLARRSLTHPQGAPRGLLLHYMLSKIGKQPCYGYEILQDIDTKTSGAWRPGAGSVYPILKKLVTDGYIKADEGADGADRKVYSITQKGLDSIKEDEKMFLNSGQRWMAMRGLFIELIRPEHLTRFMSEGTKAQFEGTREIVARRAKEMPPKDLEFILKEYILNLEQQLDWAHQNLKQVRPEAKSRTRER